MTKYEALLERVRYSNIDRNPLLNIKPIKEAVVVEKRKRLTKVVTTKLKPAQPKPNKTKQPSATKLRHSKVCSICSPTVPLPIELFGVNNAAPDGRQPYCADCTSKKAAKWYLEKHPEQKYVRKPKVPEGFKYCSRGLHTVELDKFTNVKSYKDGKFQWCKQCHLEYKKELNARKKP